MNFDELVAQSEAVRRRQEEREVRHTAMLQQRIRDIKQEMNGGWLSLILSTKAYFYRFKFISL